MNSPKNMFYGLLAAIVIMLLGGGALYYYFDKDLVALNEEVSELLAEKDVIGTQIDVYEDAKKKVEELSFVSDLADNVLPQSKEQANVVAEIRKFITDAGLTLETLTFSGSEGGAGLSISQTEAVSSLAGVRALPVNATIASGATFDQFINLLQIIEGNQRKIQVTELTLTPETGSNLFSSITLKLNIYLRTVVVTEMVETTEEVQP